LRFCALPGSSCGTSWNAAKHSSNGGFHRAKFTVYDFLTDAASSHGVGLNFELLADMAVGSIQ
jgi:hypothetical protein